MWYYKDNGERLLEQGSPVRPYGTASLLQKGLIDMTKEKRTFAWDTILTMSLTSDKKTVQGTDIEVEWCPITRMYWEV